MITDNNKPGLTYRVKKLDDGFMAQCTTNPEISIYAKEEKEIDSRINKALQGYIDLFPYKVNKLFTQDRTLQIKKEQ